MKKSNYPLYHYGIEQRSEEWFKLRQLHLTASKASTIITNGKGLETLCKEIVRDYISPEETPDFKSKSMVFGELREPIAIQHFENFSGKKVTPVTFVEKNKYAGCSPDGLIGKDEGIEIKSPSLTTFIDYVEMTEEELLKEVKDYYNQCQMNLYITKRKKWYLVLFNENFKKDLIVLDIYPDEETFKKLEMGLKAGEKRIKQLLKLMKIK